MNLWNIFIATTLRGSWIYMTIMHRIFTVSISLQKITILRRLAAVPVATLFVVANSVIISLRRHTISSDVWNENKFRFQQCFTHNLPLVIQGNGLCSNVFCDRRLIDPYHKSHNALDKYPTIHQNMLLKTHDIRVHECFNNRDGYINVPILVVSNHRRYMIPTAHSAINICFWYIS